MYAAHFAAALAIKGTAPKVPVAALLVGVFIPDFFWITLAAIGVEPAEPAVYFDEWSHSLCSVAMEATFFALCFYRRGFSVWALIWLATFSHFLLDWLIHPVPLALYPHSSIHLGFSLWTWGLSKYWLGRSHYWWIQMIVLLPLLAIYIRGAVRSDVRWNLVAASSVIVICLHFVF